MIPHYIMCLLLLMVLSFNLITSEEIDTSVSLSSGNNKCLFDDLVFSMTPHAKDLLRNELQTEEFIKALEWAKQEDRYLNNTYANSKSIVQEGFIFLLRVLAKRQLLPFHGSRAYGGLKMWFVRPMKKDPRYTKYAYSSAIFERYYIDMFLRAHVDKLKGPTCLEWDIGYMNRVPVCKNKYSIQYREGKTTVEGKTIYGDIYNLAEAGVKFDTIIATMVFEHLLYPDRAMQVLYDSMNAGGTLFFTVPQSSQLHGVPSDYHRYTKFKVRQMMMDVGFCVPKSHMGGGGDFIIDAARSLGMRTSDFTQEELMWGYGRSMQEISDGAVVIMAVAYKAPFNHKACRSAPNKK
eukprot:CAMPEP_0185037074 /NCGR_PEP_ID=MMETSP1103-20130426/30968_1 /TAXON_ID=36769 /ORGANISM="Paraphysomonas bandaiensis, Strain Caron Lab Isolate" /LENGTH=348 /DNA_ID=CAMNT_0027574881 /DNA_START=52 /DNA_END=1098 /DNA_ORIENTATION=+